MVDPALSVCSPVELKPCRMARGHKEASTSQARRKRGTPREMPMASSLLAAMSVEDLRSFRQVPAAIGLEMSDDATTSTMGATDNVVYFTREQFTVGLCLPIPSLVKQFLHFTRPPPALIHLNLFWILMGCSVLNFLYQLDISLVEICFIYTLKVRIGGMSTHSHRLQFVNGLSDSPQDRSERGCFYNTLVIFKHN